MDWSQPRHSRRTFFFFSFFFKPIKEQSECCCAVHISATTHGPGDPDRMDGTGVYPPSQKLPLQKKKKHQNLFLSKTNRDSFLPPPDFGRAGNEQTHGNEEKQKHPTQPRSLSGKIFILVQAVPPRTEDEPNRVYSVYSLWRVYMRVRPRTPPSPGGVTASHSSAPGRRGCALVSGDWREDDCLRGTGGWVRWTWFK